MPFFTVAGPRPIPALGYDNLANWPSVLNRPVLSGSTLVWIGPLGGGASTASDVAQSLVLSASGTLTTTSNGQVIVGLNITGDGIFGNLIIDHDNVIVRHSRIRGHAAGVGFGNVVQLNGLNTVFDDCLIDGNSTQSPVLNAQNGMQPNSVGPYVFRRCRFINLENHVRSGSNMTIIDCLFHLTAGADADMIELDGNNSTGESDSNLIKHNTFDGRDTLAGFLNSAVNMTNFLGGVTNIALENNAFVDLGITTHDINDDDGQGGPTPVTGSAVNNGFFSTNGTRIGDATLSPNSGNFTMATADATTGALLGGTGIL